MPRKPKRAKEKITVVVNGKPITAILHPPSSKRTSWFVYTSGWDTSRSTGQKDLQTAVVVAENMIKDGCRRPIIATATLTNEEFEKIQKVHFAKKTDPAAKARAAKTLEDCLDAIAAFKAISGLEHVAQATPDDCERFQREALKRPKNWRQLYPKSKKDYDCISPNTVLKWSRQLQAAFERANRNAGRRKCVRGVVDNTKLLNSNPWNQFQWVEGTRRPIHQFDSDDLLSFLDFLESKWRQVPLAVIAAKIFLWSACRKLEVASLTWESLREIRDEFHFEIAGKWGVERWFRIPGSVLHDLSRYRVSSRFVFAAYTQQIRAAHAANVGCLKKIRDDFSPRNFGRWFYERVKEWSATRVNGRAYVHIFRKTALQLAHDGEDEESSLNVARDAGVSEHVLLGHYVKPKLWHKSNRTFRRILAGLPAEVARRYGHVETDGKTIDLQVRQAVNAGEWDKVAALSAELARRDKAQAS